MERLDKLLSRELNITRTQSKALIKRGAVSVNGKAAVSGDLKCDENDEVICDGRAVNRREHVYIMLNKPKGVVSATEDGADKTVLDLLPENMRRRGLFPAGRLDKDTTGFVLITDDGEFAHNILSPAKHIDKTYIARLDKPFTEEVRADFERGMTLGENELLEAQLGAIDNDYTKALVVLRQGLYHQVKRMFKKHGITVLELRRIKMGGLPLDEALKEGEARYISGEELLLITG